MTTSATSATTRPSPRRLVRRLAVPAVAAGALVVSAGAASAAQDHVVGPGESLSTIARDLGTSVTELAELNGITNIHHVERGQRLTVPESAVATPTDVGTLLTEVAREQGWSPAFVKALAWQESGWQQDVVSSAGAIGIMQVMPGTGEFVSQELVGRHLDLDDPRDNVIAGVTFLQHLWELTGGDAERTLAGYYQGLASVRANGLYDDTERYIDNVLTLRERFR